MPRSVQGCLACTSILEDASRNFLPFILAHEQILPRETSNSGGFRAKQDYAGLGPAAAWGWIWGQKGVRPTPIWRER